MQLKRWTKEEDDILIKNYYIHGAIGIFNNKLLDRSIKAIINRAFILNIKASKKKISIRTSKRAIIRNKNLKLKNDKLAKDKIKEIKTLYFKQKLNQTEISKKLKIPEYALIRLIKENKYNNSTWNNDKIKLLKKYYYSKNKIFLQKKIGLSWQTIVKKANLLKIKRNPKFQYKGMIHNTIYNNNMNYPEIRKKMSESMKRHIRANPEKLLNRMLRRNRKTYIEAQVENILIKNNINYKYNQYVKTKDSYKFPDFLIGNLIIECDGERFHQDSIKETQRDRDLMEMGYGILHFSGKKIRNNINVVERCILNAIN